LVSETPQQVGPVVKKSKIKTSFHYLQGGMHCSEKSGKYNHKIQNTEGFTGGWMRGFRIPAQKRATPHALEGGGKKTFAGKPVLYSHWTLALPEDSPFIKVPLQADSDQLRESPDEGERNAIQLLGWLA
jgi:hypothetical protein